MVVGFGLGFRSHGFWLWLLEVLRILTQYRRLNYQSRVSGVISPHFRV